MLKRYRVEIFLIALLFATLALKVKVHINCYKAGYRISRLKRENERFLENKRKLELELAVLRSPQRIRYLAKEKLHLIPPSPERMFVIK